VDEPRALETLAKLLESKKAFIVQSIITICLDLDVRFVEI
jgi:hypothetical protein